MTIWQALAEKLGRQPTNAEANAEVKRILKEANEARIVNLAGEGKLSFQRGRRARSSRKH